MSMPSLLAVVLTLDGQTVLQVSLHALQICSVSPIALFKNVMLLLEIIDSHNKRRIDFARML